MPSDDGFLESPAIPRLPRAASFSEQSALWWRRGESNPCPRSFPRKLLHAYPVISFKEPNVAPAHCRLPSVHEILHRPSRPPRRTISLLSMFPAVAGVQPETSRSIKPRERDLGDLRLFFWSGF